MDSAKGIAVASTGTVSVWDYVMREAQPKEDILSLIQIPTLAGTGSELNNIGVISNWETHEKRILFHPKAWAKVSIIDPELTITVPKFQTGSGAADTFSHIVEYYLMPEKRLPVNDAWREALMRIIIEFLPRALAKPDDIEARTQLSWTSTIAMSQLARIGGTEGLMTCHSIEHALSAIYDVAHGAGLAALLPAWMKRIQPMRQERFDMLGKNVFGKKDGIKAFEEWLEEVGIRIRLGDLGCEIERADDIAENVLLTSPGGIDQYPGNLDAEAIAQIYRDSF